VQRPALTHGAGDREVAAVEGCQAAERERGGDRPDLEGFKVQGLGLSVEG